MKYPILALASLTLSYATPSMQHGGWVKAIKPNTPQVTKSEPAQPPLDTKALMAKLKRSTPLLSHELGYLVQLRSKYQANPVSFKGTEQEELLKTWKANYKDYGSARLSTDPKVNALWDSVIQRKKLTESELDVVKAVKSQYQANPTKFKGSLEESIVKTIK